ncbi:MULTISPECIES: hypothetical protein [Acidiplasma]|nr:MULTISPECIES: hypothetical protein [Acidiplasma]WMT54517.1 MAG: hypothetical protein RE470_06255 [Acidiplasma sp.]
MEKINDYFYIFGGIKGLIRDGDELKRQLYFVKPEIMMITISPEEVKGIKYFIENPFEMTLSDYEIIYGVNLSKYGEVMTPSPVYIEAARYSIDNNIELIGLDMNEDEYQRAYSRDVKTLDLIRHSIRKKRISRTAFNNKTPEEYVDEWNKMVDINGFKKLNEERLVYIEKRINEILNEKNNELKMCISDYDFYKDLVKYFKNRNQN